MVASPGAPTVSSTSQLDSELTSKQQELQLRLQQLDHFQKLQHQSQSSKASTRSPSLDYSLDLGDASKLEAITSEVGDSSKTKALLETMKLAMEKITRLEKMVSTQRELAADLEKRNKQLVLDIQSAKEPFSTTTNEAIVELHSARGPLRSRVVVLAQQDATLQTLKKQREKQIAELERDNNDLILEIAEYQEEGITVAEVEKQRVQLVALREQLLFEPARLEEARCYYLHLRAQAHEQLEQRVRLADDTVRALQERKRELEHVLAVRLSTDPSVLPLSGSPRAPTSPSASSLPPTTPTLLGASPARQPITKLGRYWCLLQNSPNFHRSPSTSSPPLSTSIRYQYADGTFRPGHRSPPDPPDMRPPNLLDPPPACVNQQFR